MLMEEQEVWDGVDGNIRGGASQTGSAWKRKQRSSLIHPGLYQNLITRRRWRRRSKGVRARTECVYTNSYTLGYSKVCERVERASTEMAPGLLGLSILNNSLAGPRKYTASLPVCGSTFLKGPCRILRADTALSLYIILSALPTPDDDDNGDI
ncbi:hypothetical protein V1477_008403 [Vespula maculifrons]